ncbi:MAG: hypothetical protein K6E88_03075, partial [Lachnospiraceae bacterium]|nr:hypothetical protein [Lachnospiraceae bacterium]
FMLVPWTGWLPDIYPKITQDHSDVTPDEYDKIAKPEVIDDNSGLDKDIHSFITNMKNGAVAGFKYFDLKGLKKIAIRTKGYGRGRIEVYAALKDDPKSRKLIGSIPVSSTNAYKRDECSISTDGENGIKDGIYALYFKFSGESNLNFLDFELII